VNVAEETHLAGFSANYDASAGVGPNPTTHDYYSPTKGQMTTTDGGHTPTPPLSSAPYHIAPPPWSVFRYSLSLWSVQHGRDAGEKQTDLVVGVAREYSHRSRSWWGGIVGWARTTPQKIMLRSLFHRDRIAYGGAEDG
jgi:hypothetical protein